METTTIPEERDESAAEQNSVQIVTPESSTSSDIKIDESNDDDVYNSKIDELRAQKICINVFCATDDDKIKLVFIPDSNTFIHKLSLIDSILYHFSTPGNQSLNQRRNFLPFYLIFLIAFFFRVPAHGFSTTSSSNRTG